MRNLRLLVLPALGLLALGLPAQTTRVVPGIYANLEGPSNSSPPFYYETTRTQILYRAGALARAGGVLMGVHFRRDGNTSSPFSGCTRDIRIDFCQTSVSPAAMTTSFASNRGTNTPSTLFTGKVNLPALPVPATKPAPWAVSFTFAKPQPFVNANGHVLLEFLHRGPGTSTNRYYMDGEYLSKNPGGRSSLIAMYCTGSNQAVFKSDPDTRTWILGGKAEVRWGPGGSQPTTILAFIGNRSDRWGPVKLPFDLAPLGGTSASKDPCMLYTNYLVGQTLALNQKGAFGPIPNNPALANVTLFTQGLAAVKGANALGVITGPAFSITIGSSQPPVPDVNLMYSYNNNNAATGRLYGSTNAYRGPVTKFTGVFN